MGKGPAHVKSSTCVRPTRDNDASVLHAPAARDEDPGRTLLACSEHNAEAVARLVRRFEWDGGDL